MTPIPHLTPRDHSPIDSSYAWIRLGCVLVIGVIGCVGNWSAIVAIPAVQAEFGVTRAEASLPFTLAMVGFAVGGVLMGRLVDRYGMTLPMCVSAVALGLGYVIAGLAPNLWMFALAHGVLIGVGTSACFGPLMADVSHWFMRRRGIAVSIAASGSYLAGVIWPPVVQHFIGSAGWRPAHIGVGIFCFVTMVPMSFLLRRKAPAPATALAHVSASGAQHSLGLSPSVLQTLLTVASLACCVAMAMPQVHIVAYCGDLGYGVARGAEMLSLMFLFGVASRIFSGWIADKIGGLRTLLLGSVLQGVALFLYLLFDQLASLYVISALFGLFQGGIVPSYAIIVREYFPPQEAGTRVGIVLVTSLAGMAIGGWLSGAIFDYTGSYRAAFANGLAWNFLNVIIALWLLTRARQREVYA